MTEFLFIPAHYEKGIVLTDKALEELRKYKKIALFASVQFIKLETIVRQLKENGIKVLTTHGKRTSGEFQLLGCDCFNDSFENKKIFDECDVILYIGDGLFHPIALLLSQQQSKNPKPIMLYDPISKTIKEINQNETKSNLKKYKANLMKYINADKIGVLVSTKTGQQHLKNALLLKEKSDKQVYIFVEDTFNFSNMENFPFIDVWVNTACPRIGYDDVLHLPKSTININDAFNPGEALKRFL